VALANETASGVSAGTGGTGKLSGLPMAALAHTIHAGFFTGVSSLVSTSFAAFF
jgi:hypothetical protein